MVSYKNFIGIDIGKYNFVVALHAKKATKSYENSTEGINKFMREFKAELESSFCVLENTGGYETRLLLTLCDRGIAVHKADPSKVKFFIRSLRNGAKTDVLDAKALAFYGLERHQMLSVFVQQSKNLLLLYNFVARRQDITQMLVAEKNRSQAPEAGAMAQSYSAVIESLSKQLDFINAKINELVDQDKILKEKKEVLKTIPGIGNTIACSLLALMPELGNMNRRQAASLAGVAPRACDSGTLQGYRRTVHGRHPIKPLLFMAAMAGRNSHSSFKAFYEGLIQRGKKGIVSLVALMRKIIVVANARLRDLCLQSTDQAKDKARDEVKNGAPRTSGYIKAAHEKPLIGAPSLDVPFTGTSRCNAPSTDVLLREHIVHKDTNTDEQKHKSG